MSKKKHALLVTLGLIALFAVCIGCVILYAHYEINKPTFEIPEEVPAKSATEIPSNDGEKLSYIEELFNKALSSETNVTKTVDTSIDSDSVTSTLSSADTSVILLAANSAVGTIKEDYETYEKINSDELKTVPKFSLSKNDISECTIEQGITADDGTVSDDDYYYFTASVGKNDYPASKNISETFETEKSEDIINEIKDELSPSVKIVDSYIHIDSCSASGRIDRVYDELDYIEFARTYEITAYVEFTGDYSSLGEAQITFNYTVKFKYDFTWYGARFTQEADYMNPGNSQTLPVSVIVADTATSDDYKLTFTSSDENIATVDTDGIITAENSSDTTAVITVTLEYRGVTYTDTINITVTDLEVE